jgi:hypothetical protein
MPQLIGYILLIAAYIFVAGVAMSIGAVFGCCIALYNYCCAFFNNVKPEKI